MQLAHLTLAAITMAVSRVMADTCQLTAFNNVASTINGPGGVGSGNSLDSGFYLVINGGEQLTLTADSGNDFHPTTAAPAPLVAKSSTATPPLRESPRATWESV
ncbi:hypothetical protein LTR62_005899 [Meristemomyces frigidus]|uniref:Uncharacterized protein n=1 Tax=Meristemomyces frigidus TaxID=1508187 RepID=A0AAN7TMV8_9PEZI|nr:hypothetical protein LTR62_005899 [Meristemomyces frigidus]